MLDFSFLFLCMSLGPPLHLITITDAYVYKFLRPKLHLVMQSALTHPYTKVLAFYASAKQTLSCLTPASITEPVLNLFAELWPCTYFVPHPLGSKSSCQIVRQKGTDKRFLMVLPESLRPPRSHSVDSKSLSRIIWSSPPFAGREAEFHSREN